MKRPNYNSLFQMTGLKRDHTRDASPSTPTAETCVPDRKSLLLFVLISFLLCVAPSAFGSTWTAPATDLANSIARSTGAGSINLSITNSSTLSKADVADIQQAIETQLRSAGLRIVTGANANSDVDVTLSENIEGYVWVAEIKRGNETHVEMISVPRTEAPAPPHSGPSVVIRKTLLWSQSAQILDAYTDKDRMVVLDAASVSTLAQRDGKWERDQTIGIHASHIFPRDVRGLLVPAKDHLADAYLPGTICNVAAGGGIALSCRDSDDPWPLGTKSALFNSGRNYFSELLSIYKPGGPFYSLVSVPHSGSELLLTTGVDGRVHVNDGSSTRVLAVSSTAEWGSDMAAIRTNCGSGTQILVTSAGDDTMTDSLRAFEIPDREPVQVSAAADFPGPITALWTHGESVTAVSHNLSTGSYEAYSVSVTCNQ